MFTQTKIKLLMMLAWAWIILFSCACRKCKPTPTSIPPIFQNICFSSDALYPTQATKFVVLIQDGVRYSEGFGDSTFKNIPHLKTLSSQGSLFDSFYNNNITNTINGCCACIAGTYLSMPNNTTALPIFPSVLNYYLYCSGLPYNKACIISSKDKIETLAHCSDSSIKTPIPYTDCGVKGNGTGYRHDTITFSRAKEYLSTQEPNVIFITFREPDFSGHTGVWNDYLNGIKLTDSLINELYNFIQSLPAYKNKTDFFITNDHGRHLDSLGGFTNHGDNCWGCKKISLLAVGPDFKQNYKVTKAYEQIDISKTLAYLLHLNMPHSSGKIMYEILK